MDKDTLVTFIEKYNLGGTVESVKLVSDGSVLKTVFVAEDKCLAGSVTAKKLQIDAAELHIFDTSKFKNFLRILDSNITIGYNYEDKDSTDEESGEETVVKTLTSLSLADANTEATFVLSDPSVIPPTPKVKEIKEFNVEIPIDDAFVTRFVKAKSVLPDVDTFTVLPNKKTGKLELIVGYATSANTNRVKVEIKPTQDKDTLDAAISFNANYLRDILIANKEAKGAVLKICAAGIAQVSFSTDDFDSNYFLIKKSIDN